MFPTAARLSKASRAPLTPKRGNKDYYKGTRQAFLPGGHRTGAPGKHVIRGRAKYRLLDEKVRVYVAPPIEEIEASPLKPYVAIGKRLTADQKVAVFSKFRASGGVTPEHFLRVAREHTLARENPGSPAPRIERLPTWMNARIRLGLMEDPKKVPVLVTDPESAGRSPGRLQSLGSKLGIGGKLKELKVVKPGSRPS
ncbi:hypothetical protein M413DRAFT_448682 [Hebeloma cylindrosporum]|uniref:Uncharacterized protein n=1 Tax=Hebeloma cylindrosporum TaxID=76867 RepID=A0A0C3BKF3_HEBCY|nr:hypothetical protein M413DRAFT_448682 [Hebeloma cylindrosporum h7]